MSNPLEILELIGTGISIFEQYAPVIEQGLEEIPDLVSKAKALSAGVGKVIGDAKAADPTGASTDLSTVMSTIGGVFDDVKVTAGQVASVVKAAPNLPSVNGLQSFLNGLHL